MKFLATIAKYVQEGMVFLTGFAPLISQTHPDAAPVLHNADDVLVKIAGVLADIQVAGNALTLTGPQKLTAAVPIVSQLLKDSALLVGHEINDLPAYTTAAQGIASNLVDLLNSLKTSNITVTNK